MLSGKGSVLTIFVQAGGADGHRGVGQVASGPQLVVGGLDLFCQVGTGGGALVQALGLGRQAEGAVPGNDQLDDSGWRPCRPLWQGRDRQGGPAKQ